jgi:DNA excision repair protein ERCC-4
VKIDQLRIIVDEREKKSGIPDLLKAVGVNIEVRTLQLVTI